MPNISHVFRKDQHLYLLYEIYSPAHEKLAADASKGTKAGINLLSSLELIQGSTKVYETPLVQAKAINVEGPGCGGHRTGCAAGGPEGRLVPVPVERDRRCGWQLCVSAVCGAGAGAGGGGCAGRSSRRVGCCATESLIACFVVAMESCAFPGPRIGTWGTQHHDRSGFGVHSSLGLTFPVEKAERMGFLWA